MARNRGKRNLFLRIALPVGVLPAAVLLSVASPVAFGYAPWAATPVGSKAAAVGAYGRHSAQAAQAAGEKAPAFEVASIRLSKPSDGQLTSIGEWGLPRFRATNVTLEFLLSVAYDVDSKQIVGAPSWIGSQTFVVDAKVEGDRALGYREMRPLLQQLLVERFHLKSHRETRNMQGYALEVAKNGIKLKSGEEKSRQAQIGQAQVGQAQILPDQLQCPSCSLGTLAGLLARVTGRPVSDATGVNGKYEISLKYAPRDATDSQLPSVYAALQEQLGLKLSTRQIPVEMLVVDHVDRNPTED